MMPCSMFGAAGKWYYSTLAGLGRAPASRSWKNLVIAPPGPTFDGRMSVYGSNVSWAAASIDTPMGLVSNAWSTLPASSGGLCGTAPENGEVYLSCDGGTFSAVAFASFGTPTGDCVKGFNTSSCNAADSVAAVSAACIGKSSCTVPATNAFFNGDPCQNIGACHDASVQCHWRGPGTPASASVACAVPLRVIRLFLRSP